MTVLDHNLCKEIRDGQPVDITKTFTADDSVYCWLQIKGASIGDKASWLFKGPKGLEVMKSLAVEKADDQSRYTRLDLSLYSNAEVTGNWTVTVSFNGDDLFTDDFTVQPLTGLVWWGPFAGALLFISIAFLILAALVTVIILLIKQRDIAGHMQ